MKSPKFLLPLLVLAFLSACQTNPFTGKKGLALIPNSTLFPMSFQQYDEVLNESKVIKGTKEANLVRFVGEKIARAAEQYLHAEGEQGYLKDYKWEYQDRKSTRLNSSH